METLFQFAIFSLPINGIPGIGAFGELKSSLTFYLMLILMLGSLPKLGKTDDQEKFFHLKVIFWAIMSSIALSLVVNLLDIMEHSLKGRSGSQKFFNSWVLLIFMFGMAWVSGTLIKSQKDIERLFLRPLMYSTFACAVVAVPEVLSWFSDAWQNIYLKISALIHAGVSVTIFPFRLRSLSYEPPSFSSFVGFALPWLICGYRLSKRWAENRMSKLYGAAAALAVVMLFLSNSRTGVIIAGGWLISEALLLWAMVYRNADPRTVRWLAMVYIVPLSVLGIVELIYYNDMVQWMLGGVNISNISRFASNVAAFTLLSQHPVLGVGLGQYAFGAVDTLPQWAWFSYEISDWFTDPAKAWPPVFNMYARLGAELGLFGLLIWCGFWVWLLGNVLSYTASERQLTGHVPAVGLALISSIVFVLLIGISNDTFGLIGVWIVMGFAQAYKLFIQSGEKAHAPAPTA